MNSVMFLFLSAISAVTDLASGKIFNGILLSGLLGVLLARFLEGGPQGLFRALFMCVATLLAFLPLYAVRGLGAGDVKLFACLSPFLATAADVLRFAAVSFLAGGAIGMALLLTGKGKRHTMHFALPMLISAVYMVYGGRL